MAQKVRLNNVRVAFAHDLWVASTQSDDPKATPKFGCAILIDPADPQVKTINAAIEEAAKEKWGAKAAIQLKAVRAVGKGGVNDGDLKTWAGFPGNLYLSAKNSIRPTIIDADKSPLVQSDGKPYSGSYCNFSVEFAAYDNPKSSAKGIMCILLGVQFFRDGESFGGGGAVASADEFDDVTEGATAEDLV